MTNDHLERRSVVIRTNSRTVVLTGWRAWAFGAAIIVGAWLLFALVAIMFVGAALTFGLLFLLLLPALAVAAVVQGLARRG